MGFDEITQKVIVKGKKEAWGLSSGASQHVGVRKSQQRKLTGEVISSDYWLEKLCHESI